LQFGYDPTVLDTIILLKPGLTEKKDLQEAPYRFSAKTV
jgi:hypothetical protein